MCWFSEKILISHNSRQGYSFYGIYIYHLWTIYIDYAIKNQKNKIKTEINLRNIMFYNIVFADDICLFQDNEGI